MKTIEQMAEASGFVNDHSDGEPVRLIFKHGADEGELARFAALVRAEALEEAAVICEAIGEKNFFSIAEECSNVIRAAKEAKP